LLSQLLKSEVFSKFFAVVNLYTELLNQFYLPFCFFDGSSVLRDFMAYNTTASLILLENVHIIIAHSSEEGGATERCGARTNDSYGFLVRSRKVLRERGISDLWDTHLFKDSNGKFL